MICGIVTACKLPRLLKRTAADYPGVDPEQFAVWHKADLMSAYAFLIASWGTLLIQIIVLVMAGTVSALAGNETALYAGYGISFAVFIGLLVWAAVLGEKAKKLKKGLGIK